MTDVVYVGVQNAHVFICVCVCVVNRTRVVFSNSKESRKEIHCCKCVRVLHVCKDIIFITNKQQ